MEAALILCGFNATTALHLIEQGFTTPPKELLLAPEAPNLDSIA